MYHVAQPSTVIEPDIESMLAIFAQVFGENYRTKLVGGAVEPFYQPASQTGDWACIYFTRDYFASALHEVAHWCVAGEERRRQVDYGYWYTPDGRSPAQQKVFEKVEVVPQALEWIFSVACGQHFKISADNLESQLGASKEFKEVVWRQVHSYCHRGLPRRANDFAFALAKQFAQGDPLAASRYQLSDI